VKCSTFSPVSVRKTSPDRIIDSPNARSVGRLYFSPANPFSLTTVSQDPAFPADIFFVKPLIGINNLWENPDLLVIFAPT
jgi:hypothetical protein